MGGAAQCCTWGLIGGGEEKLKLEDKATSPSTVRRRGIQRVEGKEKEETEGTTVTTTRCNLTLPPVTWTTNQICLYMRRWLNQPKVPLRTVISVHK